jgi:hypothetical protein
MVTASKKMKDSIKNQKKEGRGYQLLRNLKDFESLILKTYGFPLR